MTSTTAQGYSVELLLHTPPTGPFRATATADPATRTVAYCVTGRRLAGVITLAPPTRDDDPFAPPHPHSTVPPPQAIALLGRDNGRRFGPPEERADVPVVNGIPLSGSHPLRLDPDRPGHLTRFDVRRATAEWAVAPAATNKTLRAVAYALLGEYLARPDLDELARAAARPNASGWKRDTEATIAATMSELNRTQGRLELLRLHQRVLERFLAGDPIPLRPITTPHPGAPDVQPAAGPEHFRALADIHAAMDGQEWNGTTFETIRDALHAAGMPLRGTE